MSGTNVIQGIGPDGKRRPIQVDEEGRFPADSDSMQVAHADLLLEMRSVRLGLEILLELQPGTLLAMAGQAD